MGLQRIKMLRTVESANFDDNESNVIGSIMYNPSQTYRLIPTEFDDDATLTTPVPIVIYGYEFEVTTNVLTEMFQTYHDEDDAAVAQAWDPGNMTFLSVCKQDKLVPGKVTAYSHGVTGTDITTVADWATRTIKFRAKGYWSKKHKEYRWTIPPIVLSHNKQNMISWCITNVEGLNNKRYYAKLKITNWKQIK